MIFAFWENLHLVLSEIIPCTLKKVQTVIQIEKLLTRWALFKYAFFASLVLMNTIYLKTDEVQKKKLAILLWFKNNDKSLMNRTYVNFVANVKNVNLCIVHWTLSIICIEPTACSQICFLFCWVSFCFVLFFILVSGKKNQKNSQ